MREQSFYFIDIKVFVISLKKQLKMFKYIHGKGYILKNFHAGCLSIDNTGERLGFWLTGMLNVTVKI